MFIPVCEEKYFGRSEKDPVLRFQKFTVYSATIYIIVNKQGARKDGRGNEPLPLRNVRCAEPPEDS